MERYFYGIGLTLALAGLCLFDYRLALVVGGVAGVCLGLVFDFGVGNRTKDE